MSSCRLKCNLCHLLGFIIADISNQYFFPQTGQQLALRNPQEDFSSALNCPRGSSKWALITPRGQGQSAPSAWSLRIRQRQGVRDRPSETDRERWSRTGRTPGSGAGPPPRLDPWLTPSRTVGPGLHFCCFKSPVCGAVLWWLSVALTFCTSRCGPGRPAASLGVG